MMLRTILVITILKVKIKSFKLFLRNHDISQQFHFCSFTTNIIHDNMFNVADSINDLTDVFDSVTDVPSPHLLVFRSTATLKYTSLASNYFPLLQTIFLNSDWNFLSKNP